MAGTTALIHHRVPSCWSPDRILTEASQRRSDEVISFIVDSLISHLGADTGLILLDSGDSPETLVAREADRSSSASSSSRPSRTARRSREWKNRTLTRHTLKSERTRFQQQGSGSGGSEWSLAIPFRRAGTRAALLLRGRVLSPPGPTRPDRQLSGQISSVLSASFVLSTLLRELESSRDDRADREGPSSPCRNGFASIDTRGGNLQRLFPELVGRSAVLLDVLRTIAEHAQTDVPILIQGESGTGKELVAHAIHRLSTRAEGPIVSENCGAIPEHLVEAELFGHERGSFTGAEQSRAGIVERAHGGTLFLDEVSEMDIGLQKKFLRVLQESSVRRVGGDEAREIDMRVVSATNRDLEAMVEAGLFRADLFYRLHVAHVRLPPLRERREDIPLLVEHFARVHAERVERPPLVLTDEALDALEGYLWPGNIRELTNEIWRLVSSGLREVRSADLAERIQRHGDTRRTPESSGYYGIEQWGCETSRAFEALSHGGTLEEIERRLLGPVLRRVLTECRGNRSRAARRLAVGRATLYRRIERYGLERYGLENAVPEEKE